MNPHKRSPTICGEMLRVTLRERILYKEIQIRLHRRNSKHKIKMGNRWTKSIKKWHRRDEKYRNRGHANDKNRISTNRIQVQIALREFYIHQWTRQGEE